MHLNERLESCGYSIRPVDLVGSKFLFHLKGIDAKNDHIFDGEPIGFDVRAQTVLGLITGVAEDVGSVRLFVSVPLIMASRPNGPYFNLRVEYIIIEHPEIGNSMSVFNEQKGRSFGLNGTLIIY
jgi:hypothetical protein